LIKLIDRYYVFFFLVTLNNSAENAAINASKEIDLTGNTDVNNASCNSVAIKKNQSLILDNVLKKNRRC